MSGPLTNRVGDGSRLLRRADRDGGSRLRRWRRTGRGLYRTLVGAWLECVSFRAAFWAGIAAMTLNNLVWLLVWAFFFDEVGTVRGWDGDRIRLLLAVLATSAGIVLGLFNNSRRLTELAADGALDAALTLPVPTLGYLLCRVVSPVSLGDLFFGIVLFALIGDPDPARIVMFVAAVAGSAGVLIGFLVLVGAIGIRYHSRFVSEQGFQAITLFSFYPVDVFGPKARFLLYVVVPAGFVTAVPTRLLDRFDPGLLALEAVAATVMVAVGSVAFRRSLRAYTSGAGWTTP